MQYKNHIMTDDSVVIVSDQGYFQCHSSMGAYAKLRKLLDLHKFAEAMAMIDVPSRLRAYSGGKFMVADGEVYLDKDKLPDVLAKRLLDFCDNDIDCVPLIRFWENLSQNPSADSRQDLFAFLEHNSISLTADGCFVGYKRVMDDYASYHQGVYVQDDQGNWSLDRDQRYDHTPGKEVTMPREMVDPNREHTCSTGLHVAAFNYAQGFYGSGKGRLVEIKVNPRDVVAVPPDYNQEKMRVCAYTVVRECVEEYKKPLYEHDKSFQTFDNNPNVDVSQVATIKPKSTRDESTSQTLVPDARGRLLIPAALIRAIGLEAGDCTAVVVKGKTITISSGGDSPVVDMYCNVRLGKTVLEEAKLNECKAIKAKVVDESIVLS